MGFAPTWLRQVSPLLHMTTLTTALGLQAWLILQKPAIAAQLRCVKPVITRYPLYNMMAESELFHLTVHQPLLVTLWYIVNQKVDATAPPQSEKYAIHRSRILSLPPFLFTESSTAYKFKLNCVSKTTALQPQVT